MAKASPHTATVPSENGASADNDEPILLDDSLPLLEESDDEPESEAAYYASIFPGKRYPVPAAFAALIQELETELKMPVWLLVQSGASDRPFDFLSDALAVAFYMARDTLPKNGPVALLIDSPGGSAEGAYRIAMLLRRHCNGFTAVIPRYAKSAATILTLGAEKIILGGYAELGPLDAQVEDFEREDSGSALNEVQALERLHAFAMDSVDQTMMLMSRRSGKKISTLLPIALSFISDLTRPLFEKIDTVHYTQMARILKVAEQYTVRLLKPKYSDEEAKDIARKLVEAYPEHGFIIDAEEANDIGIETTEPSAELSRIMDAILPYLGREAMIGRLMEVTE